MSKPSILVAGAGLGAALILWTGKHHDHDAPAAASKPAPVHTVIVHSVTHTVTRVVENSPLSGWQIVIVAVVALGTFCAVTLGRRSA